MRNQKRKKQPKIAQCKICKKEFIQKRKDNLTCSSQCSQKLWVINNPDENWNRYNSINAKERQKKWRDDNKEKVNIIKQRYKKNRRKSDLKYKINELMSNAVRASIFNKSFKKWEIIVGYDLETLICHLSTTLPIGVTWDDYLKSQKKYHIDHIIPKFIYIFADYKDKEFKKCWNYRNLRIITKEENLKKLNKLDMNLVKEYNIENLLPNRLL